MSRRSIVESLEGRQLLYAVDLGTVSGRPESSVALLDERVYRMASKGDSNALLVSGVSNATPTRINLPNDFWPIEIRHAPEPSTLVRVGKRVLFTYGNLTNPAFVGWTNGTTTRLTEIVGTSVAQPSGNAFVGESAVVFPMRDSLVVAERDGSRPRAVPVAGIDYNASEPTSHFVEYGGSIYFIVRVGSNGVVHRLEDVASDAPRVVSMRVNASSISLLDGKMLLATYDAGRRSTRPWTYDGVNKPTLLANVDMTSMPTLAADRAWFVVQNSQIWSTDGTPASTSKAFTLTSTDVDDRLIERFAASETHLLYATSASSLYALPIGSSSPTLLAGNVSVDDFYTPLRFRRLPDGSMSVSYVTKSETGAGVLRRFTNGILSKVDGLSARFRYVTSSANADLYGTDVGDSNPSQIAADRHSNAPPRVKFPKPSLSIVEGRPFEITASLATDPDGDSIEYYEWDLDGDGDFSDFKTTHRTLSGSWDRIEPIFLANPSPRVAVRASDGESVSTPAAVTLGASDVAPGLTLTIDGSASTRLEAVVRARVTDVAMDPLQSTVIDWGDGTPTVTFVGEHVGHRYARPGRYTVSVTATNADASTTKNAKVTVRDLAAERPAIPAWQTLGVVAVNTSANSQASPTVLQANGLDFVVGRWPNEDVSSLFVLDGSPGGIRKLRIPGAVMNAASIGDRVIVLTEIAKRVRKQQAKYAVYATDGTIAGTRLLAETTDIWSPQIAGADGLAAFAHVSYGPMVSGIQQLTQHLWTSDGTPEGTRSVPWIATSAGSVFQFDRARKVAAGGLLVGMGHPSGDAGAALHVTPSGAIDAPIIPIDAVRRTDGRHVWWDRDALELRVSDGSRAGRTRLGTIPSNPPLTPTDEVTLLSTAENRVYFSRGGDVGIIRADGSSETLRSGRSAMLGLHRGSLFFLSPDSRGRLQIYRTEGSIETTYRLTNAKNGVLTDLLGSRREFRSAGKMAFILLGGFDRRDALFRSDGEAIGTYLLDEARNYTISDLLVTGATLQYGRQSAKAVWMTTRGTRSTTTAIATPPFGTSLSGAAIFRATTFGAALAAEDLTATGVRTYFVHSWLA